ncbi:MAG: aldose epimerase [Anaerolineae bacterium]|nr:aldose epimerase [Anaerolineae bacterium]
MPPALYTIANDHWQVGILPETGGSIAFGRIRRGDGYADVMRPTAEADYTNASLCSSFIMLPWVNRLRDARFRFRDADYQLEPTSADGTAMHGAVRRLPWRVVSADETSIRLIFDSALHEKVNFPFEFSAEADYRLDGSDLVMALRLHNEDRQAFPAGFGHHPYFLRAPGGADNGVQLEIPCDQQYTLVDALPTGPAHAITPAVDFRSLRPLGDIQYDDLLTGRQGDKPMRMVYPGWGAELEFQADPIFSHWILFGPQGKPFFALEPQTSANDGFNLAAQGIESAGVFTLETGEMREGVCRLRLK